MSRPTPASRFEDVAGVDEAKEELQEIVEFLKNPRAVQPPRRRACRRACCWSGRPAPARRCSPRRWRAKPRCRSSRSPAPSSSKCSSASAPRGCATCSSRRGPRRRPSSSSTNWMRSAAPAASARTRAGMTRRSRRSTSSSPRWTASTRATGLVHPGGDQPAGDSRSGAAAGRPLRPPGAGRPARQERARRRSCASTSGRRSSPPTSIPRRWRR